MARIAGVNVPDQKHIVIGLTYVYGIGRNRAKDICQETNVKPSAKVNALSETELEAIRAAVAKYKVEGDLRREVAINIKQLVEIGTYRGKRHRRGLPVRGQRTKTNARTRKGKSRKRVTK